MRHLRITIGNKSYDVTVEDVTETHAPSSPLSAAPSSSPPTPASAPEPKRAANPPQPTETGAVASPMAGVIKTVHVKPGDQVSASQALIVLEAMKMDNQITAPVAGTVKSVDVAVGDSVAEGHILLHLE